MLAPGHVSLGRLLQVGDGWHRSCLGLLSAEAEGFVLLQHRRTWGTAVPRSWAARLVQEGRQQSLGAVVKHSGVFLLPGAAGSTARARHAVQPAPTPAGAAAGGGCSPGGCRPGPWSGMKNTNWPPDRGFDVAHVNLNVGGQLCSCDFSY